LIALDSPANLKKNSVHDDLFEVALPAFRGARESLTGLDDLIAFSYFGERLHLFCRRGAYTAESLEQAIKARGLDVQTVTAIPISLEDAFIRLVQKPKDSDN